MEFHLQHLLAIAVGGAAGAVSRYIVVWLCMRQMGDHFPYGVLLVNVAGCFLLGLLMHDSWVAGGRLSLASHAALSVGFLGALTTFSTFGYDTLRYLEQGNLGLAGLYVFASLSAGLGACWLGRMAGNSLWMA